MNYLAQTLLLPGLRLLQQDAAPKVTVHSYYVDRTSATDHLKPGGLNLLLDTPTVNAREFVQQELGQLPYVAAMRPGHPLAKQPVTLKSYLSEEHLHVSSRRKGRCQTDLFWTAPRCW